MNPPHARPASSAAASADISKLVGKPEAKSFRSVLDRTADQSPDRTPARPRSGRANPSDESADRDSRIRERPLREAINEARMSPREDIAVGFVVPALPLPAPSPEGLSPRQSPRPAQPVARAESSSGPALLLTPPGVQQLPVEETAGARTSIPSTPVEKSAPAILHKPATNTTANSSRDSDPADQLMADDATESPELSSLEEMTERFAPKSEPNATPHTNARTILRASASAESSEAAVVSNELLLDGDVRGTTGAIQDQKMKNAVKQNETAASAKQILPEARNVAFGSAPTEPRLARDRIRDSIASDTLVNSANLRGLPTPADAEPLSTGDGFATRLSPMGRMAEVLTREVWMFKQTANDTVEVVLTPDQHTQISLRLQWRDGAVEAEARCQQGDFDAFRAQWPALQEALAHQGVRLAALTPTHLVGWFGSSGFGQSANGGSPHHETPVAATELPPIMIPGKSVATPLRAPHSAHRLLESWA